MQLFIALIYMIGKITSNVGQTIFGTLVFIAYFVSPRSHLFKHISQSVVPITATANVIIVFTSRFPSLNHQANVIENDFRETNHFNKKQQIIIKSLKILGIIYGVINILNGSFVGGAALIRYPLLCINNDAVKLLVSSVFIAYIAVCSSKTFYSYNFRRISHNAEKFVEILSRQTIIETAMHILWMNKKTLVICAAGAISYLGFTYIMTKQLFHEILGDHINPSVVNAVSLAVLLPAFIAQLLSVVVATWEYIEEDKKIFTAAQYHFMHKLFIGFICIMAFIEVTSTGLGNFVGTTALLQDFLCISPYSSLAYIIAGIAGACSAFQEYSFNALVGIKNVADCILFPPQSTLNEETLLISSPTTITTTCFAKVLGCYGLFSCNQKQYTIGSDVSSAEAYRHNGKLYTYGSVNGNT